MTMQTIELTAVMLLASFAIVMVVMPRFIEKLKKRGTVATDQYKRDSRNIHALLLLLSVNLCDRIDNSYDSVFRKLRLWRLLSLSDRSYLCIGSSEPRDVNRHSGFNGLASGLSGIVLAFLLVKFILTGYDGVFVLSCLIGATVGFLWYNGYPARVFMANIGSLSLGAAIGAAIVVSGFLVSGFIMLIPHTINFLMYVYWRLMHKLHPEDWRWSIEKFGKVRGDGTLEVPNPLTLKWVLPYYFRIFDKNVLTQMPPYHCLFKAIFMLLLTVNDLKTINIPLRASGENL